MTPISVASAAAPPLFLRLSGHPVRWRLLAELVRSDRQVRELSRLIDERQSLTSYHLGRLRAGGLVSMRRSSADRRDAYYSLDLAACRERLAEAVGALHPGLQWSAPPVSGPVPRATDSRPRAANQRPVRVLFLCTGNSSRSQMAEALVQRFGGGQIDAASAGSHPKGLHPGAVQVMGERGIDIGGRRSKPLSEFTSQRFDYVISLCDKLREMCPDFPGPPTVAHWSIPDPAESADDGLLAFVRTADELTTRIEFLLSAIEHQRTHQKEVFHG